jgi:PAS domain S-box-containing protein
MKKPRILIVEDESIVARDISQQLDALGYESAGHTLSAEEGIALTNQLRPDLVLMDIQLAGEMDGIEAARAIREQFAIPVVFLTAFVSEEVLDRAKRAEPFGYIVKPFDERELRTTIEMALYKHEVESRLRQNQMEQRANEARYLRQRNALITFSGIGPGTDEDLAATFRRLTETAAKTLDVARVSVWRYNRDRTAIQCADLYELEADRHSSGTELSAAAYPAYFQALARADMIAADDAEHDPNTSEFSEHYLRPLGITSMLDARIQSGGAVDGILCHEHVGPGRQWTADEKTFAVAVANLASLAVERWERQRAEESQVRLATAVEQAAESIVITDKRGAILYANPAFAKNSGYTCAEVLGLNPRLLKSGTQDGEYYRRMWAVLKTGEVWRGHFVNKRKDGTLYEEEATISPIRDSGGAITNYVAVKRDVTREVQLEAQFRQAQKMEAFGQLAGGVAHDFNNILAIIMMQAGILRSGSEHAAEVATMAADICKAAERGANLTRQLLLFSRRQTLQPRNLDLNQNVTSVAKMLQRIVGEDIRMQLKCAANPLWVHADPGMLDQILMNLTVNSRDAMPDGGDLLIETSAVDLDDFAAMQSQRGRPGSFVRVSVTDTGGGISASVLPRIFEPFFTTKEVGKGTGLGLATVFSIAQQHDGWVDVYSEGGRGTTFRVYLPRLTGAVDPGAKPVVESPLSAGKELILLVEDEANLRTLVSRGLSRLGYRVLEAGTGVEARDVWLQNRDDVRLMITDMVMPGGMNGKELSNQLQHENPKLKVIYMSGYSNEVAGMDLQLREGVNFLSKPFVMHNLANVLRTRLDN